MKKPLFTVVLLCAVLCLALSACVQTPDVSSSPTPAPTAGVEATATAELSQDEKEFTYLKSGDVYRIYHWWLQQGQEAEEFRGDDVISRARANTIDTLEEEYGIKYQFIAFTGSYWNEVYSSAFTGEPIADGMHGGSVNLLLDHYYYQDSPGSILRAISDYDVSFEDSAYWNTEQQDAFCKFDGKLYAFIMGTCGMKSIETAKVIFFNYELCEAAGYDYKRLYKMVEDKQWNWDAFEELATVTNDPDHEVYGTTLWQMGVQLALSNNAEVVSKVSVDNTLHDRFTGDGAGCIAGWDFLTKLYNKGCTVPLDMGLSDPECIQLFKAGKVALMCNHWRRCFDSAISGSLKHGWLPIPMGPEATEYFGESAIGEGFEIFKNGIENANGLLKAMKELYKPYTVVGSEEDLQLFDSQITEFCNDQESKDFLYSLAPLCRLERSGFYGLNWQYGSPETNKKILTGEVAAQAYFESVAPTYNDTIMNMLREN